MPSFSTIMLGTPVTAAPVEQASDTFGGIVGSGPSDTTISTGPSNAAGAVATPLFLATFVAGSVGALLTVV